MVKSVLMVCSLALLCTLLGAGHVTGAGDAGEEGLLNPEELVKHGIKDVERQYHMTQAVERGELWTRDPFLVCKEFLLSTDERSRLVNESERPGPSMEYGSSLTVTISETGFVKNPDAVHEMTFRLQRQPNGSWLPVEVGSLTQ